MLMVAIWWWCAPRATTSGDPEHRRSARSATPGSPSRSAPCTPRRGTYGARRVHAELTLGLGLQIGHNQVEMLMARATIKGLPGDRRPRPRHETPTATDLVERMFTREQPNRLWVTDIVRREALFDRVEVRDHYVPAVAAAG